jgi:sialate O-acetylesterase
MITTSPRAQRSAALWLPLVAFVLTLGLAHADDNFKLASIFSDGAVLQRGKPVAIFGTGNPHDPVTVKVGTQSKDGSVGDDGKWTVMLDPIPVGGPYVLHVSSAGVDATVDHVFSGDVYLCSGQSNMQFTLKEATDAHDVMDQASQDTQLHLFGGKWQQPDSKTAGDFSAVGYLFGHALIQDPALANVPIGLIHESFGGSSIESWLSKEALEGIPVDTMSKSMYAGPSGYYDGMIAPITPYTLSGVLWYQGEANAGKPAAYEHLLTTLISTWRKAFNDPNLPFFIIQLPSLKDKWDGYYFTWVRDAQAKVAAEVPGVDLCVTYDTCDGSNLHPKTKHAIGDRLALLARRDIYKEKVVAEGPKEKSVEADVDGTRLHVHFDTAGEAMSGKDGQDVTGFEIAGDDGNYSPAEATIDGTTVTLKSDGVQNPKTVRYAFTGVPKANLINADGLPAEPFRTDTVAPNKEHQ